MPRLKMRKYFGHWDDKKSAKDTRRLKDAKRTLIAVKISGCKDSASLLYQL